MHFKGHGVATFSYYTGISTEGGKLKGSFVLGLGTGRAKIVGVEGQANWRSPTPFCFAMTGGAGREWIFATKTAKGQKKWVTEINRARVDHGLAT